MTTPAIVLKSKFVLPNSKEYKNYINYINRDGTKIKVQTDDNDKDNDFKIFHNYMDYMDDNEKKGNLFGKYSDTLNESELKDIRNKFKQAQDNNAVMWQDVISFDNEFLEEIGIYDSQTGYINEKKIKNMTRDVVREMANNENLDINTLAWSGAVHYNTDNIHVHLAITEPNPTRDKLTQYNGDYRGKRKPQTLEKMKRCVAKNLYNRNKDLQKIDELIRNPVRNKRSTTVGNDNKFIYHFNKALEKLPNNKRYWQYGYHAINNAREHIDEISEQFMETYYADEYKELKERLEKQVELSKRLYGDNSNADKYKSNKLNDLKKRLGNAILQELKESDSKKTSEFTFKNIKHFKSTGEINKVKWNNKNIKRQTNNMNSQRKPSKYISTSVNIFKFNRAMRKTYHEYKKEQDMQEFERMQEGYEV